MSEQARLVELLTVVCRGSVDRWGDFCAALAVGVRGFSGPSVWRFRIDQ